MEEARYRVGLFLCGNRHGVSMDYATVEQVFSQAIPNLFGITTSTHCGSFISPSSV